MDLGCGNGKLWQRLVEQGFQGQYIGLGFQRRIAKSGSPAGKPNQCRCSPAISPPLFIQADLTENGWENGISQPVYDFVLAFAVLHHLPGELNVVRVLQQIRRFLAPGGKFIFSVWQFLNSPRLRERIQDWSEIGLSTSQVEQGDYLLDWRQGGHGLRYVHAFTADELESLASRCGFIAQRLTFQMGKVAILAYTRPGNWKM